MPVYKSTGRMEEVSPDFSPDWGWGILRPFDYFLKAFPTYNPTLRICNSGDL